MIIWSAVAAGVSATLLVMIAEGIVVYIVYRIVVKWWRW